MKTAFLFKTITYKDRYKIYASLQSGNVFSLIAYSFHSYADIKQTKSLEHLTVCEMNK